MSRRSQARNRAATRPPKCYTPPNHGYYFPGSSVLHRIVTLPSSRRYQIQDDGSAKRIVREVPTSDVPSFAKPATVPTNPPKDRTLPWWRRTLQRLNTALRYPKVPR